MMHYDRSLANSSLIAEEGVRRNVALDLLLIVVSAWSFCVNDLRLERFVSREDSSVSNHYCCRKQENKLEDSGRESSDNKIVQCRREFYKSGES